MNTFDGYIRRNGTNSKVLLDGGNAKALSEFIGTISYANNKITYTKADGTSYDLVDLSNYIYNLRVATSDSLGGIRIGFSQSGKNYPVQLDSNNKAYVYVPWEENSHYTTRLYVGDGTAENKITTNGNTRITVTDNNNVRNYITLIGSGATNVSSDDNGKITINSINTTYNTGDSATLNKGTNTEGKLWSAKTLVDYISDILGVDSTAITSLNTLIGQLHDNDTATGILVELAKKLNIPSSSIGSNNQPIYWNGSSFTTIGYTIEKSVPSNAIFTDTKYSFYVGENNNIKEHKNVSNPYFKLFENNTPTSIQIKAGTGISVSSDTNGNITIKNESPDQNHNTWRPIKIEGTEKLGSTTNTDALDLTAGNGIEVSYDSTNKKVIIKNTKPDQNHDTHYTTSMYIGENNDTKANKAVNSPYFKLFDNDTRRSTFRFIAGNGIGIASDDNGNITITNSSPDKNHNTDKTGIKLGTISGTKKTDSTVIINNSSTGLTIAGGTNKFSIGDGTNYIEIPITPSFTVSNKDSTIGTSLTTIATIAGTDIKAKIDSYLPLSGGTMTGVINWGTGSTREILQFSTHQNWKSGLRYSWKNNTTISLWGENQGTAFVWNAGKDGEINGHSSEIYDFKIRRESNVVVARIAGNTVYHTGNLPAYPTKESWNYDDRYLKLSGGTITGDIVLHDDVAVIWSPNFTNYIRMPFRIEDGNYFTGINLYNVRGTIYTKLGIFTNEDGVGNDINSIFLYPNSAPKIGTNTIYHSGNLSISKSGETLTVNIGGTSYSLTNTNTWREITDSYSGTDSTISLSQKGGNDLYNSLLNGYASSAGNATNATYANYLNIVAGNEIRFNNKPSSSIHVYFNYVWAGGIADDKIKDYRFMNGNKGYAEIVAEQLQCTNGYLYLWGPGRDIYNVGAIFSNSYGLTIETPRATNASNGTVLPLMVKTRGGQWGELQTGTMVANGNVTATAFYASSDLRLKNILTHPNYSAEQLASLPLVKYTLKDKENDFIHLGSIAQNAEEDFAELVNTDNEGYKSLDYATLGTIGVISLAREIVELKKEIKELKSKLYG